MADGEQDAEGPADGDAPRGPLPPEDRVWRHPAEVAMEARRAATHRRARHRRVTATAAGGVVLAAGLLWLVQAAPTTLTVEAGVTSLAADPPAPPPTVLAVAAATDSTFTAEPAGSEVMSVRLNDGSDAMAGALMVRDGYVITSGRALGNAQDVVVTWGDRSEPGTVIGYDAITDVSVIRVDAHPPGRGRADAARVSTGDRVTLANPDGWADTHTVVDVASASERENGEPVVGIVELDSTRGEVPAGSPAFDTDGAIVGMLTSTADDAPAAIVPIALVRVVAAEIIDVGVATHPWLGIRARNPVVTGDDVPGSLVTEVTPDGPAALGGVEVGDLIVSIDRAAIVSMESMIATVRSYEPGDAVSVVVLRDGAPVECTVALDSHIDDVA